MAKWTMEGMSEYIAYLQSIASVTGEAIGAGVYAMAEVVADKVRANIQALPTVSNEANIATYRQGYSRLSEPEKKGLLDGFGVSPMQDDGGYKNVKLGFDGYNGVKTKKYPNGQPNALIARVTESGSSYRQKTPFVRPAVNASRKEALEKGREAVDRVLEAVPDK